MLVQVVPIVKRIFTEEESKELLEFLKEKAYVYHTPYKRYNKMVKVPRGQATFTLNENIHYNYGRIAGGSPPNELMCDRLKEPVPSLPCFSLNCEPTSSFPVKTQLRNFCV